MPITKDGFAKIDKSKKKIYYPSRKKIYYPAGRYDS